MKRLTPFIIQPAKAGLIALFSFLGLAKKSIQGQRSASLTTQQMTWSCRLSLWSSQTMINYCISGRSMPFSCSIDYVSCSDSKAKLIVSAKICILLHADSPHSLFAGHEHAVIPREPSEVYSGTGILLLSFYKSNWVPECSCTLYKLLLCTGSQGSAAFWKIVWSQLYIRKMPEWKK